MFKACKFILMSSFEVKFTSSPLLHFTVRSQWWKTWGIMILVSGVYNGHTHVCNVFKCQNVTIYSNGGHPIILCSCKTP